MWAQSWPASANTLKHDDCGFSHGVRMAMFKLQNSISSGGGGGGSLVLSVLLRGWRSERSYFHLCLETLGTSRCPRSWLRQSLRQMTADAWRGHWMWFPMTSTNQSSPAAAGVSRRDSDTSQNHSRSDGARFMDSQRWHVDSHDSKVGEALKRPGRGLSPLGNAIMTLLSLSMSIALQSISLTSRRPANDRKCR